MINVPKADIGIWEGSVQMSGAELKLILHVGRAPDGTLAASLDSPNQNAVGLKVDAIDIDDDGMRFEMAGLAAAFEGTRDEPGTTITGKLNQAGTRVSLALRWQETASEIRRPQTPKEPFPYRAEDVTYENALGGVRLAGTLTIPEGHGPFPAALLITGSGPQDRDETLFGHKPFLVLADHLTRAGLAVLRVDDRGVGGSTGDTGNSTSDDLAGDVEAGVAFLEARPEIDAARIGLIGHSEGGLIAPMVAARSSSIAFIVLMAGPGLPGEDILLLQGALIARAGGASEQQIEASRDLQRRIFAVVRSEPDPRVAEARLRLTIKEGLDRLATEHASDAGVVATTAEAVEAQVRAVQSPWFRYFLTYDPRPMLRKVTCPVLAINGENDLQVPPRENLAAIDLALTEGGNTRVTVKTLPKLNHLFQTSVTGHVFEYASIEETIAPAALELIASWIREQVGGVAGAR